MNRKRTQPHGVALMLVVIIMAVATVMAYSLLAGSVMQEQAAATQTAAAQVDALAESGVQLAMYYLQHSNTAPTLVADTAKAGGPNYWPGASNIHFNNFSGSVTVTVTPSISSYYTWTLNSTATYTPTNGAAVSKSVSATALVTSIFDEPVVTGAALTLNPGMSVSNPGGTAIIANGGVTVSAGIPPATVSGAISATSVSPSGYTVLPAPTVNPVPSSTTVKTYATYTYNGQTYTAGAVNTPLLAIYNPSPATNPLGVFEYSGATFALNIATVVNGTLYVPGNLTVSGIDVIGPAAAGYPALVVGGKIQIAPASSLIVNGLAYVGQGISSTLPLLSATSSINVNGALVMGGALSSSYAGAFNVTYNSSVNSVTNFTPTGPYVTGVKLTNWNP